MTCDYPLLNGSSLYILDYSEPATVGTTISFNCSQPGEVLVGRNTATCMEDGQWMPDPCQVQISCKGTLNIIMLMLMHNYSEIWSFGLHAYKCKKYFNHKCTFLIPGSLRILLQYFMCKLSGVDVRERSVELVSVVNLE